MMQDPRIERGIFELKIIRKKELTKREFYTRIMEALHLMGDSLNLTVEETIEIRNALISIGFIPLNKLKIKNNNIKYPLETGNILEALKMISQIYNYQNAKYGLFFMNMGNDISRASRWLVASKKLLNMNVYYRKKSKDFEAASSTRKNDLYDFLQEQEA